MDFDFSSEDRMVQEQVKRYLSEQCPLTIHRSVMEGHAVQAIDVWKGLSELGLQGTAIPEAYGGVGAGYLPLCLVAQELGAVLVPVPFSSSIYLAAEAITLFGSEEQKEHYLPKLASGELIGTFAANEALVETSTDKIDVVLNNSKIRGRKLVVPHGLVADVAIVLVRSDSGPELVIVSLEGIARTPIEIVDPSIAAATLDFDGEPCEVLGVKGNGLERYQTLIHRAAVLLAFEQIGGAEQALNMAVGYAKERFAFGRPIGSFQALKHMMADMYVALKLAESNAFYAAWALQNDAKDLALAAATARVSATQAFQLCARDNIQVHGGMGFTWAFDCHLYYRRSNYLAVALGGARVWENYLINALPGMAA